jgi:hypothetical protein
MRRNEPVTVARIDFNDFESCRSLKHAIWSSRDREWLRGAALMLQRDVAIAREYDEDSQARRRSIVSTSDDEWLRTTAEYLLRSNCDLANQRRMAAARPASPATSAAPSPAPSPAPAPLQRVVEKVVLDRDPATGLIVKIRETTLL